MVDDDGAWRDRLRGRGELKSAKQVTLGVTTGSGGPTAARRRSSKRAGWPAPAGCRSAVGAAARRPSKSWRQHEMPDASGYRARYQYFHPNHERARAGAGARTAGLCESCSRLAAVSEWMRVLAVPAEPAPAGRSASVSGVGGCRGGLERAVVLQRWVGYAPAASPHRGLPVGDIIRQGVPRVGDALLCGRDPPGSGRWFA